MTIPDKSLCHAWVDADGDRGYIDARGYIRDEADDLGSHIAADGFDVEWPDGPGVATLTPRRDLWAELREAIDRGFLSEVADAAEELLAAHDRGKQ